MSTTSLRNMTVTGALGAMHLLAKHDDQDAAVRKVRLEAAPDSRSVILIERDQRRAGTQREIRHEITPAELIALIRAHGAELPGERHVSAEAR